MNPCRYHQLLAVYIGAERFAHVADEGEHGGREVAE